MSLEPGAARYCRAFQLLVKKTPHYLTLDLIGDTLKAGDLSLTFTLMGMMPPLLLHRSAIFDLRSAAIADKQCGYLETRGGDGS
jgi:hypothetical protein